MAPDAWLAIAVTGAVVVAMVRNLAGPDLLMMGAITAFLVAGVLTPAEALAGFSNEAVLTVGALFVVARAVQETGGLDFVVRTILGQPRTAVGAQLRLMVPVSGISAFVNNTPVVAMLVPVVSDWSRRVGLSPSRLLIPLSYASILGGMCTLIGTSTNLVVAGMAAAGPNGVQLGLFEISALGVPCALVGITFIATAGRHLLPDRDPRRETLDSRPEYTVSMSVEPGSPIIGSSIENAGLRRLPGLYLMGIERDHQSMVAVGPTTRILAGDTLVFTGVVESVVDLRRIRGLVPAADQVRKLDPSTTQRRLVEAVVAPHSPLVGHTVSDSRFRTRYGAAIIAVRRSGERIRAKVGDISLEAGDVLLLEARPTFIKNHRRDVFALVSEVAGSEPVKHEKAGLAVAVVAAMVAANVLGWVSLLTASLLACGALLLARCMTGTDARRSIDLRVLVTIAAAFGVGTALAKTGAAGAVGSLLVDTARPLGPTGVLAAVYVAAAAFATIIGNNAAAALMFPVVEAVAQQSGLPLRPALLVLMVAASASFATPIGYQTNLMVLGPGGYRFADFLRIGVPLQILTGAVAVVVAGALWL